MWLRLVPAAANCHPIGVLSTYQNASLPGTPTAEVFAPHDWSLSRKARWTRIEIRIFLVTLTNTSPELFSGTNLITELHRLQAQHIEPTNFD
jgi:hypothetical protein